MRNIAQLLKYIFTLDAMNNFDDIIEYSIN